MRFARLHKCERLYGARHGLIDKEPLSNSQKFLDRELLPAQALSTILHRHRDLAGKMSLLREV
jgi:hypothetical protein